jgi:hypothetical protein
LTNVQSDSDHSIAIFIPKTGELITGDVVAGGEHLNLAWGRSAVWQDRINELKALEPKWIYPGHGTPGGPELLDQTLEYLKFFHDTVAEKVKPGAPATISGADHRDVKTKMMARFPKLGRPELLDQAIRGEYAVQLSAMPPAVAPATPAPGAAGSPTTPSTAAPATPPPAAASPSTTSGSGPVDDLLGDSEQPGTKKGKKKK